MNFLSNITIKIKVLSIVIALTLPILYLSYLYITDSLAVIDSKKLELTGLDYQDRLRPLLKTFAVHRGLSSTFLSGDESVKNSLSTAAEDIDQGLQELLNFHNEWSHGGSRRNLEIKLFGAGNVLVGNGDVGVKNIKFIYDFMRIEGYKITSEDLGGDFPRRINYCPMTGKVMMKRLVSANLVDIQLQERKLQNQVESTPVVGEIDLF